MGDTIMPSATDGLSARAAERKNSSGRKKPDFFIVGAPKCGTSWLAHYLAAHPNIFMARKEMHFFGADLRFGPQFYRRDLDSYLAEFDGWAGQTRAGEASVWYLFSQQAAAQIKAFNSEARILILLRQPAAMLYSLYHQFRADGNERLGSFEAALALEPERRAGRFVWRQTYFPQGLDYRATARYTEQVRRYFEVFGRERVHVILYDELAADPAKTYRQTLNFLDLPAQGVDFGFEVINGNKTVRSPALRAVLNDPAVRGAAIALRSRLPRPVFRLLQRTAAQLGGWNHRVEKRPPLSPDLELSLRCEFASEVERLGELLGRDLTHWTKPEPPIAGVHPPPISYSAETICPTPSPTFSHRGGDLG